MSRIGVIGTDPIAVPMVRRLAARNHRIIVTEHNSSRSSDLRPGLLALLRTSDAGQAVFCISHPSGGSFHSLKNPARASTRGTSEAIGARLEGQG